MTAMVLTHIQEFDRQVDTLIQKGFPQLAKLTDSAFEQLTNPLRVQLDQLSLPEIDLEQGILPFVIVVKHDLVSTEDMMARIERNGKQGITKLYPREPQDFNPIDTVTIPQPPIYLLVDIDRGKSTINLPPIEAMKVIVEGGRSPLTIDEGVAIVMQYPEFLMKNNCFSLLASRYTGDKRVPAIWINGKKHPNLGWCWDGNPHTWLGSASCTDRIG